MCNYNACDKYEKDNKNGFTTSRRYINILKQTEYDGIRIYKIKMLKRGLNYYRYRRYIAVLLNTVQ